MLLSHIKLIYKVLGCFFLFAAMVGGATYITVQKFEETGSNYDGIIHEDVVGLKNNLQSNIDLTVITLLGYRHWTADTPEAMAEIEAEVARREAEFPKLLEASKPLVPASFGPRFDDNIIKFDTLMKAFHEFEKASRANDDVLSRRGLQEISAEVDDLRASTRSLSEDILKNMNEEVSAADENTAASITETVALLSGASFLAIALAFLILQFNVVRPLKRLVGVVQKLAVSDYDVQITGTNRRDEVGLLAANIQTLKQNALDAIQQREKAINDERYLVNRSIGAGVESLASKNLTYRITEDMPSAYATLQRNFNAAMEELEGVIKSVTATTHTISSGTGQISVASHDLSRRTESQAANLEETAAAVAEIAGRVKQSAQGASNARTMAALARDNATNGGDVVQKAMESMKGIEQSSKKITQIIGVMDEIAFQTNLLALNAGVEAARAGEAGRGFAVVASEVRALAQRSSEAAKEIKVLIDSASVEVEQGVTLVGQTGASLKKIIANVMEINEVVAEIAQAADEQSAGISEVNTAVGEMDNSTQQNAAMVEEATAATQHLATQSLDLNTLVSAFVISKSQAGASRAKAAPEPHAAAPMAPARKKVA